MCATMDDFFLCSLKFARGIDVWVCILLIQFVLGGWYSQSHGYGTRSMKLELILLVDVMI
jgi:hypothetical protein